MKFRLIVLILLCLGFTCNAQNKRDNMGRRQGKWIKTDKDGSRIFEGEFKDDKEIGVFNYYYPDGTLKIRNTYTIPGRYCRHEAYDRQGHLLATGFFDQKNRDSVWHFYNEQGRLVKTAGYRMGIKQGAHIIFTATGDTAEISNWDDNRRHGRWWKRIGEKGWISGKYINGLMQGKLVEYADNGQKVREGNYKDGMKDGKYQYFENGSVTVDETWQTGTLTDRKIRINVNNSIRMQSVFGIAYFLPKGSNGTIVFLNDGSKLMCSDQFETINERVGRDLFVIVDRNSRLMANIGNIIDIVPDDDGRPTLELEPKPPFEIFPDDDCIKLVKSLKRLDELDE
ncbi:MAG: hypothetical protein J6X86_03505 [Bacteroidales bacterium]|nr:hypothetical protein [Bacteroidales bacterium]